MKYLDKVAISSRQRTVLTGNPGQRITLHLRYLPTQQQWLMDVEWQDFIVHGIAVLASPNLLHNYRNIIPFGIACTTTDGLDPYFLQDFATRRCSLYLLNADDVTRIEAEVYAA